MGKGAEKIFGPKKKNVGWWWNFLLNDEFNIYIQHKTLNIIIYYRKKEDELSRTCGT
jgi:hypothetical protein